MKKIIYSLLAVAALTLSSCEDFTDLQPKGKNLLTTTDQLEMLLNTEVSSCSSDMRQMAGDMIYAYSNIATTISQPVKTRGVIIWTYDEASMDKMAELTANDGDYSTFYGYIGTISNPILTKIDEASGSEAAKKQIKGQIGVACDNRENFALDFGKSFLHYGWEKNVDRLYEQVDEITAAQIQAVAQELFDKDRLTTLIFK